MKQAVGGSGATKYVHDDRSRLSLGSTDLYNGSLKVSTADRSLVVSTADRSLVVSTADRSQAWLVLLGSLNFTVQFGANSWQYLFYV